MRCLQICFFRGRRQWAQPSRMCILVPAPSPSPKCAFLKSGGPGIVSCILCIYVLRVAPAPVPSNMYILASPDLVESRHFCWRCKAGSGGRGREGVQFKFSAVAPGQPAGFQPHSTPCASFSTQILAVYQKPPSRGRIHIIRGISRFSKILGS